MIKVITRNEVESQLNVKFRPHSFNLKYTDHEDTDNIVNLCQKRKKILEIGTLFGHTAQAIATYNPKSIITTINITKEFGLKMGLDYQMHELLDESQSGIMIRSKNVTKLIIDSDSFFKSTNDTWNVIFLDGDHSYNQVKKDTENALLHLETNGLIIWHDIYNKDRLCAKCNCEPSFNDVREYLESLPIVINKIERSWVGYYEHRT